VAGDRAFVYVHWKRKGKPVLSPPKISKASCEGRRADDLGLKVDEETEKAGDKRGRQVTLEGTGFAILRQNSNDARRQTGLNLGPWMRTAWLYWKSEGDPNFSRALGGSIIMQTFE